MAELERILMLQFRSPQPPLHLLADKVSQNEASEYFQILPCLDALVTFQAEASLPHLKCRKTIYLKTYS